MAEARAIFRCCVYCAQKYHGQEYFDDRGRVESTWRNFANRSKGIYKSARIAGALDAITRVALGRNVRYYAAATMRGHARRALRLGHGL
eukprot:4636456-Lingulodinium_polyedra.AAC.1